MTNDATASNLTDYILSGHAFLHCPTTEKTRFQSELTTIAESLPDDGRQVFTWSHATGWLDSEGNAPSGVQIGQPDPQKVPQEILELPEAAIFVLKDFGYYVQAKDYSYADIVTAWLCEIRDVLASSGRTVIFLGPDFEVPAALANDVTTVEFPLPNDEAIEKSVRFVMDGHDFDEAILPSIVSACRGMTEQQVEDRTALALRKFKTLNADAAKLILHEKADLLRRSGLLKYLEPPPGCMSLIGGCEAVKDHIRRDKTCFGEDAQAFGIDSPKGIMLVGISGCGKTAISLNAAAELNMPLIQFDVGAMMSKWVGESERNVREALRQIEAMAPCVVQMDEIEKGFGTVGSDGERVEECGSTVNVSRVWEVVDTQTGQCLTTFDWTGELNVPISDVAGIPTDDSSHDYLSLVPCESTLELVHTVQQHVGRQVQFKRREVREADHGKE